MKALYVAMMDLYFIFQFVKGQGHGNQIILRNEGKQILRAFFAHSPDSSTVSFCYDILLCHYFV